MSPNWTNKSKNGLQKGFLGLPQLTNTFIDVCVFRKALARTEQKIPEHHKVRLLRGNLVTFSEIRVSKASYISRLYPNNRLNRTKIYSKPQQRGLWLLASINLHTK